jgi:tetratricopeptide (TPR) repeat protein
LTRSENFRISSSAGVNVANKVHLSFWGIFWIDASTDETAEMGFATIGGLANKDTTFEAGKHWLANCTKPWLLVIDNADSRDMDVSKYFPAGGRGHILVTSRNPNTVVHATIGEANFGEMDEEDAITLLLKAAHQPGTDDYKDRTRRELAKPITSALGYLALALIHAGATIRRRLCTLESYLRVYSREMMSQRSMSTASLSDLSIITTYEVPFREIKKCHDLATEDAIEILYIFAFLHFQQIPESIFLNAWTNMQRLGLYPDEKAPRHLWSYKSQKGQAEAQDNFGHVPNLLSQATWDERRLRDALAILYELSFIYYDNSKQLCWMHPVVHLWARERLPAQEQKYWLDVTTNILAHSVTAEMEPSGRPYRRILIPHITACLEPRHNNAQSMNYWDDHIQATKAEKFAAVYAEAGEWKRARDIGQKIFSLRKRTYGLDNSATLKVMSDLGKIYFDLFEVGKCLEIRLGVLNARLKTVGETSPLTFKAMSDLSLTYWLAGDRRKAEALGIKAVHGLAKLLGPEDPDTVTAMFYLARTHLHLGRPHAALNNLKKVLRVRMEFFGPKHPDTLLAMSEMAMTYHSLERLDEAAELAEAVLTTRKQVLGEEHAYTLWAVNDLSKVYTDYGRAEESLDMIQDIMPIVLRTLGYHHIGVHMTKFNLARAFNALGQWHEGEKVLRWQVGNLIPTHPDFIITVAELARTCKNMGLLDEAEIHYQTALDATLKMQALGVNRRRTRNIMDQLKEIYTSQGRNEKIQEVETKISRVMTPERNLS